MASKGSRGTELKAREGLALLLADQVEAGLSRYDNCLNSGFAKLLPIGAHLEFLEHAGKAEAAEALRNLALGLGGNIARRGTTISGKQIDGVEEYESLFEQGLINSRMVQDYVGLLSQLGLVDRMAHLFDADRLLRVVHLADALGPATRDLLLRTERDATQLKAAQSIRNMARIDDFEMLDEPAPTLAAALEHEGRRYLADWAASDHPFAALVPQRVRLKIWGLISRGDGFNTRHFHHRGWATGVYYPIGLDGPGSGGALCVGRPRLARHDAPGWPEVTIRPEAGMLVLMPSFYTHWTLPLGQPGLRLSVAFDMIRDAGAALG